MRAMNGVDTTPISADEMAARSRARNVERFPVLGEIKTHPALDTVVPLMTDDEFRRFNWSIGKHGLLMPIVRADDVVIDGRCRYIACRIAGVEPRFKPFEGKLAGYDDEEIEAYIYRVNFMRQSLTPAQICVLDARRSYGPA
jgi:hypothetical protein